MQNITNKTLVICAVVIAVAIVFVQVNKSNSISEQKRLELEQKQLEIKQDECLAMLSGLKAKWWNVIGIKYNNILGDCVVTYTDPETEEVTSAMLSRMKTYSDEE